MTILKYYMRLEILLTFLFLGLFIPSCDKQNCEEVICGLNQFCNGGQCFCIDGYEGTDCQELSYLKYNGNYFVTEQCASGSTNGSYNVFIQGDGFEVNKVWFNNFLNLGISVPGYIYTDFNNMGNVIEIDYNQGLLQDVVGRGTFQEQFIPPRIDLEVTFNQGGQFKQCRLTFSKQ